jgi:NTP pyrophosphatase (non-canonical NTP hydrolase)
MSFYALAMGGEAGEAQNVVKKLWREALGIRGSRSTIAELGGELADMITYADLLAWKAGIDLWSVLQTTFNEVSEREGLETRL